MPTTPFARRGVNPALSLIYYETLRKRATGPSVKLDVLGCSGEQAPGHHLSSFLINDSLLIDAGAAGFALDLGAQRRITDAFITHTHLDHIIGLATLASNRFGCGKVAFKISGIRDVIAGLRSSFFNGIIWPDFGRITAETQPVPVLGFHQMLLEKPVHVGNVKVTAVRVNHTVPTVAFFVEERKKTLLFVGDTGPTEKVWAIALRKRNLRAVVLEASFPNRLQKLADRSGHLTPRTLEGEAKKLRMPSVPILVTHLKPQFRDEIIEELGRIKEYSLRVLEAGETFDF